MRSSGGGDGRLLIIGVPTLMFIMFLLMFAIVSRVEAQRLTPPRQYHSTHDNDDDLEENKKRTVQPKQASVILNGEESEELNENSTEKGMYVGAVCDVGNTCHGLLLHVVCNVATGLCECEKKYPVQLNPHTGCSKPKKLGDQCYYKETCEYADPQSSCIQIHHNAICQCKPGYHLVSLQKPTKRLFCAEDLVEMATDFSTLAGVVSGIAVLSGLICFVLKLFNQNLYGTGRHRYGNANLAPPILFSSDADTSDPVYGSFTGSVPTILEHEQEQERRPTVGGSMSRASSQRTIASMRRPSSAPGYHNYQPAGGSYHSRHSGSGSRQGAAHARAAETAAAILLFSYDSQDIDGFIDEDDDVMPQEMQQQQTRRTRYLELDLYEPRGLSYGSRRPSLTSVHSNNSVRSYSQRRYEREREQKEEREMQRRLAKLQQQQQEDARAQVQKQRVVDALSAAAGGSGSGSGGGGSGGSSQTVMPSPHSTDDLLPTLAEDADAAAVDIPLAISEDSTSTSIQEEKPSTSKRFP